jgi:ADP-heptose:LPS heptosyltransferase
MSRRLSTIERIAVLRANGLGDLMFALPALDALRHACPAANITLLGKAWHADFLRGRPGPVDEVFVLPDVPGITAPPTAQTDLAAIREALERLRARRFDLALQLFGGGRYSNPFLSSLGAGRTVGLQAPDAAPLDVTVPYRHFQPEVFRFLEVVGLVGAEPVTLEPRLECIPTDEREAAAILESASPAPRGAGSSSRASPRRLVAIHPGAGDERRRWPAENFGRVAGALADEGLDVIVVGSMADRRLTSSVAGASGGRAIDLGGRLSLGGLAGLLRRASLMVANDSGPLHLAQAVGAPTVGIFWCGNLINAGPIGRSRHRPLCSWRLECPVCGVNCMAAHCEHHASFVAEVRPEEVFQEALSVLQTV